MTLTRRPHRRVCTRLYQYQDDGTFFVRVQGHGERDHKVDLPSGLTLNEARVERDKLYASLRAGTYHRDTYRPAPAAPTLREMTDWYLRARAPRQRKVTQQTQRRVAKRFGSLLDIPVDHIDPLAHLVPWYDALELRQSTRWHTVRLLRAVLEHARAAGYVERNVAATLSAERAKPVLRTLPTPERIRAVIDRLHHVDALSRKESDAHAYIGVGVWAELLWATGMRGGEARWMLWSDIEEGVIRIRPEIEKTKRGRAVPVPETVERLLQAHRSFQPLDARGQDSRVFLGGATTMRYRWAEACETVGITPGRDGFTPHDLRRAAISRMARHLPVEVVMRITGHSSVDMHYHYRTPDEDYLQQARQVLDGVHSGDAQDTNDDNGDAND